MADQPTHECPGGCGVQVRFDMFACREDWYRLPLPLRKAINFWWPRHRSFPTKYEDARTKALAWYRQNPRELADVQR